VYKGKLVSESKRSAQDSEDGGGKSKAEGGNTSSSGSNSPVPKVEPEPNQAKPETKLARSEVKPGRLETRQQLVGARIVEPRSSVLKNKMVHVKRPKIGLLKKDTPISKRKLAVKNFLRQKSSGKKPLAAAKTKMQVRLTFPFLSLYNSRATLGDL
jgi:hypothetical protein